KGTGKEQKIHIEAGSGLSKEEDEKMKAEAKANETVDKAEREKVDKLNSADSLVFQTEKQLKEYGDKIPPDKKGAIETALNKLKEAPKSQNLAAVYASMAEPNAAWTAASQVTYHAQQAGTQPEDNPQNGELSSGPASGDNVTDLPSKEVK